MTAMRTCKKCNNRYAASAFATRTGSICKWCKPDAEAIKKELDIANMKLIAVGHALQGIGGETHPNFRSLELEDAFRLRAERDAAVKLNKEWEQKAATWMASPEAAQRLEGYREMGRKLAAKEAERDAAVKVLEAVLSIPDMSDADLEQLRLNCKAAIDAAGGKE